MKHLVTKFLIAMGPIIVAPIGLVDMGSQAQIQRPGIPEPFIFMAGWSDNIGTKPLFYWNNDSYQAAWRRLLLHLTVVIGTTSNADFVRSLQSQRKLFAYSVHEPTSSGNSRITPEDLSAAWAAPFRNTLAGRLPGSFDAICIEEFGFPDGSQRSKLDTQALKSLRVAYPGKLVFVYGALPMGDGGPSSLFGDKNITYDDELNAINKYADLLILENYQIDTQPDKLVLFQSMPRNIESRSHGLTKKTVYALYIDQTGSPPADGDPNVSFLEFLRNQVTLVSRTTEPTLREGFGFYVMYRAKPETVQGVIDILQGSRGSHQSQ